MTPTPTDLTALREVRDEIAADTSGLYGEPSGVQALRIIDIKLRKLAALPREAPPALVGLVHEWQAAVRASPVPPTTLRDNAARTQYRRARADRADAAHRALLAWTPDAATAPEGTPHPAGPVRTDFRAADWQAAEDIIRSIRNYLATETCYADLVKRIEARLAEPRPDGTPSKA